jgi:hypothetical protein
MQFDQSHNIVYDHADMTRLGEGPIPHDRSFEWERYSEFAPNETPPSVNIEGTARSINSFNGRDVLFDYRPPTSDRIVLHRSYLAIEGFACITGAAPVPDTSSIPWNTIAAFLTSADLTFNTSGSSLEKLDHELGHGSMIKMLTRYSSEALERNTETFFTPCIESTRDVRDMVGTPLGLSPESEKRRLDWLVRTFLVANVATQAPRPNRKIIYLGDLFDACRLQTAFYLQRLLIKLAIKPATDILFSSATPATAQYYYITKITFHPCLVACSPDMALDEARKVSENAIRMREGFMVFEPSEDNFVSGRQLTQSSVKNIQSAVITFPSTRCGDTVVIAGASVHFGVNPYQYSFNCANIDAATTSRTGGITAFQQVYATRFSPDYQLPTIITEILNGVNETIEPSTDLLAHYRTLCRYMGNREQSLPITVTQYRGGVIANDVVIEPLNMDLSSYALFCSNFFPNQLAYPHSTLGGNQLQSRIFGGATRLATGVNIVGLDPQVFVVRMRESYASIMGDTTVQLLNS